MATSDSRLVIAGLSGDSGKTIASLCLAIALRKKGLSVSAFKKGPDYIDPAWLSLVAGTVCRNLDTYMVAPDEVRRNFVREAAKSDIAIIEGNRGIFDGKDVVGSHSTAELAKLLDAPVVLVVDARKTTRTVAAIVKGCLDFDPDVRFAGVILNRVAGQRHLEMLTASIQEYCGLPVLGAIPNLGETASPIPSRHLGLVTPSELKPDSELSESLSGIAEKHLDVERLIAAAKDAGALSCQDTSKPSARSSGVRIGYFRDDVFTFYYPENLEALAAEGAEVVPVSSLTDSFLPRLDALYIGGGFPETHAEKLARNGSMMVAVRKAAMDGLPIYAECGGLIYLGRSLSWGESVFPMVDLFPIDLKIHEKPVGHGYTQVRIDRTNPFYAVGTVIRGHEFHYSGMIDLPADVESCMQVEKGVGLGGSRDGLVFRNVLGCYLHIHADGIKDWAAAMVTRAKEYRSRIASDHRADMIDRKADQIRYASASLRDKGKSGMSPKVRPAFQGWRGC